MKPVITTTQHFGITSDVPFIDVDVHGDIRLFVDAHAIRLAAEHGDGYAQSGITHIDSFFGFIVDAILIGNEDDRLKAKALLSKFHEPRETRLGLSASGFSGNGGAEVVGTRIWDMLSTDVRALLEVGIGRHIEMMPIFVPGVANDITSDLTTRIVFSVLAEYTREQMENFPELAGARPIGAGSVHQVWSLSEANWVEQNEVLPVVDGHPLLLVPKDWASPNLLFNMSRYHQVSALGFVSDDRMTVIDGKVNRPRKKDLAREPGLRPGHATNRRVTLNAHYRGNNLETSFTEFVDNKYRLRIEATRQ